MKPTYEEIKLDNGVVRRYRQPLSMLTQLLLTLYIEDIYNEVNDTHTYVSYFMIGSYGQLRTLHHESLEQAASFYYCQLAQVHHELGEALGLYPHPLTAHIEID